MEKIVKLDKLKEKLIDKIDKALDKDITSKEAYDYAQIISNMAHSEEYMKILATGLTHGFNSNPDYIEDKKLS